MTFRVMNPLANIINSKVRVSKSPGLKTPYLLLETDLDISGVQIFYLCIL